MQDTIKLPERAVNIREECDVLVAGAGTAGCVAAIAAARSGAKTVLIEKLPLPSGTMANGGMIINNFHASWTPVTKSARRIVDSIPQEILENLIEAGGCPGLVKVDAVNNPRHRPYISVPDPEIYKIVIGRMLMKAGVKLYVHTFLSDVIVENREIKAVFIQSKSGREAIRAKQYIDCTGDGDLAALAGAENFLIYDKYLCTNTVGKVFGLANVNMNVFIDYAKKKDMVVDLLRGKKYSRNDDYVRVQISFAKDEFLREKAKEVGLKGLLFLILHENTVDYVNSVGGSGMNTTDVDDLTNVEIEMQERAFKFLQFVKKNLPGFEQAVFSHSANQIGIRYSRIVKCDYTVSNDEVVNSKRFDDEIGLFGYHDYSASDPATCCMQNQGFYGLPYRMILPKGVNNLYAAGRMVTEEPRSHMSTRNTVSCMIQGQAAGTGAALCCKQGVSPRELKYKDLRAALEKAGVLFNPVDD